jgi:Flp pilus assembly protein TadB
MIEHGETLLRLVVSLIAAVPAVMAWHQAKQASAKASEAKLAAEKTEAAAAQHRKDMSTDLRETTLKLNGRLEDLVRVTREAGYQHGLAEGMNLERNRRANPGV